MQDWVDFVSMDKNRLQLRLKQKERFDPLVFQKMENDDLCIPCVLVDESKGIMAYQLGDMITLEEVFKQHVFEKEEGYIFLQQLFENILAVNRNKPVLMDLKYIFVGRHGDRYRFVVVPIQIEYPTKSVDLSWIQSISDCFQTTTAYEIPGFLRLCSKSDEFSIGNVMLGLEAIYQRYYPRKFPFFRRKVKQFRVAEPMHPGYWEIPKEKKEETIEDHTLLLGHEMRSCAYLMIDDQRYDLIHEVNVVGRSLTCDIRLQDPGISQKHAKITCQEMRYYLIDLKSKNGTYLNDKKVIRRMRLKEGMVIRFAHLDAQYHEI